MTKRATLLLLIAGLSLGALLVGGCAPSSPATQVSSTETTSAPEPVATPDEIIQEEVIQVEVTDYGWTPDVITIGVGDQVTIELTNTGDMPHGIYIPALGVNEGVRSGRTILVDIEAPSVPGEFTIECSDPMCGTMLQHNGMVATLIITE